MNNRFIIVDGLPYLLAKDGKIYAVRWDDNGFTVGTEVNIASVPDETYSELSVKAKCAACLDSITVDKKVDSEAKYHQEGKKPVSRKKKTTNE